MTQQNPSLTSRTISAMRFPLAVMVVFIHSRMISDDYAAIDWGSFSGADVPAALQVLLSTIVSHVAVPAFYVMSGYLFFLGVKRFGRAEYVAKCRKRVGTLLVPYLLWNAFALLWTLALKLGGVVVKGKPFSGVVDYLREYASLSTFWDCKMWALERANWIGQITPPTGPILIPMWFVRDLMVIVALTPIIHFLIKRFGAAVVALFAACYVTGIWPYVHGFSVTAMFFFSLGAYFSIHGRDLVRGMWRCRYMAYVMYLPMAVAMLLLDGRRTWWGDHLYPFYVIVSVVAVICLVAELTRRGRTEGLIRLQGYTFFIFAAHGAFGLRIVTGLLGHVFPAEGTSWVLDSLHYLLIPVLTLLLCVAVYRVAQRICPRLLGVATGR